MSDELLGLRPAEMLPPHVVTELSQEALDYIDARYDNPPDSRQKLPYHGAFHTTSVVSRVERILRAVQAANPELVSERDIQIGTIAASFHDVVQHWGEGTSQIADMPAVTMKRKTGFNEEASAFMARKHMAEANEREGKELFTEVDMATVTEAIMGTVPGFDVQLRTVVQPNVTEESSIITKALALADLGGPAMDGPETYQWEGDSLFQEMNLDVRYTKDRGVPIAKIYEDAVKKRALEWTASQAEFAYGRAVRFHQTEVLWFPEEARNAVGAIFSSYNETVLAAQDVFERRSSMSCTEILVDMGFEN